LREEPGCTAGLLFCSTTSETEDYEMLESSLLVAVFVALLLSALLTSLAGWRHPERGSLGSTFAFLFLILFMAVWASSFWLARPGGAPFASVWGPLFGIGVIVALLVVVATPPRRSRSPDLPREQQQALAEIGTVFGWTFWLLMALLAGVVLAGYALL
jgi:drug/metabolite transporter (DMT)-like permease